MLHLRDLELLDLNVNTASGQTLGKNLDWWFKSDRRKRLRETLLIQDGIDPDNVIMSPAHARQRGLTSTVCFPRGNLAPEGAVIKSTAIDPAVLDADGVYRKTGPARVFYSERAAIAAVKGQSDRQIRPGDVLILCGRGPLGSGMEETYQITSALRYLSWGHDVAVITDARFSGVSTGACIGHVSPEALAGGPIGKLRDGDLIRIEIDPQQLTGSLDFIGSEKTTKPEALSPGGRGPAEWDSVLEIATRELNNRSIPSQLTADPRLPADTRLWAALQRASGGTWGGCVFDVDRIILLLTAGESAIAE
jgi:dihydroxyacid dehydratase/phosphogluconate dehydratase